MTIASRPRLQPLGLGELLDRTIRLYRRNFFTFLGILGMVYIPLSLLQIGLSYVNATQAAGQRVGLGGPPPFTPQYFTSLGINLFSGVLTVIFISGIATAVFTGAVADSYLGEPITIGGAYRRVGRKWLTLLGTLLVSAFVGAAIGIWWLIPCVGWLTGLGMLIYFQGIIIPLVASVVVLEGRSGTAALRRAWDLARTRFWWMVGFAAILGLFAQLVITGPILVLGAILGVVLSTLDVAPSAQTLALAQTIIGGLSGMVLGLLYTPIQLTAVSLVYFDLRVRSEGLDLTVRNADPAQPPAELLARAPAGGAGGLFTWREMLWFLLITAGIIAAYFVLLGIAAAIIFLAAAAFR